MILALWMIPQKFLQCFCLLFDMRAVQFFSSDNQEKILQTLEFIEFMRQP